MPQRDGSSKYTEEEPLTPASPAQNIAFSVVIPIINEEQNIHLFYEKVSTQLNKLGQAFEVIFVDDGSSDQTFAELRKLYDKYKGVIRVIRFRRHFGTTPALVAGFNRSHGKVIVTMNGDLQDDPEELPRFLSKLEDGYDVVSGWHFPRSGPFFKELLLKVFTALARRITGVQLHDIDAGFRAYSREVIEDRQFKLYGELHHFAPIIAHWCGFRVTEIKVRHRLCQLSGSKSGTKRFAQDLLGLLNILFLTTFLRVPLRLFGPLGFVVLLIGTLVNSVVVIRSYLGHQLIHNQPLLFAGILLMIFGVQCLLTGLQSEMLCHHACEPDEEYSVRQELD